MQNNDTKENHPTERFSSVQFLCELAQSNPLQIIARDQAQLDQIFGGMVNARTLANADSAGVGPNEKIRMGRRVGYTLRSLVEWVLEKVEETAKHPPALPARKVQ